MKVIGGILILCASIFVSYLYEKQQKSKAEYLSQIQEFIKFTKGQIEFFSTPYNKIIEKYTNDSELRESILSGFKSHLVILDLDDKKTVKGFFSAIGRGFASEEIALCEYTLSSLEKSIEKIKKENPNKIKIFRSMALFTAVSIIILLV